MLKEDIAKIKEEIKEFNLDMNRKLKHLEAEAVKLFEEKMGFRDEDLNLLEKNDLLKKWRQLHIQQDYIQQTNRYNPQKPNSFVSRVLIRDDIKAFADRFSKEINEVLPDPSLAKENKIIVNTIKKIDKKIPSTISALYIQDTLTNGQENDGEGDEDNDDDDGGEYYLDFENITTELQLTDRILHLPKEKQKETEDVINELLNEKDEFNFSYQVNIPGTNRFLFYLHVYFNITTFGGRKTIKLNHIEWPYLQDEDDQEELLPNQRREYQLTLSHYFIENFFDNFKKDLDALLATFTDQYLAAHEVANQEIEE